MTLRLRVAILGLLTLTASLNVAVGAAPSAPKLVVVLVVDQMRRDYIDDYGGLWTKGLRRLLDQGASFTNAAYPYLATLTCAGHATIATGTLPSTHGIISNQWWDRETQQVISCTQDPSAREVPYGDRKADGGGSARLLAVPTLANALSDAQQGRNRIAVFSLKRAAAAMLAGKKGDPVLWLQGPGWSTSTPYAQTPDKTLLKFIQGNPLEADFGKTWDHATKTSAYKYADDGLGEKPPSEWTPLMPHLLQERSGKPTTFFYTAWEESPFSDAYLGRMAGAAVDGLKLGQGETTDYLAISFSALDVVGHDFGPRSHEIQDVLLRLDDTIGTLLAQLDKKVGKDKYVVAFTADHGVAMIPEQAAREGQDAGRVKMADIMALVDNVLATKFGRGRWVAVQAYSEFYFRAGVFDRVVAEPGLLEEVVKQIEAQPGIQKVYDGRSLKGDIAPSDPLAQAAARSYFSGRSGDLIITLKPNWIFVSEDKTIVPGNATTHGSSNPYDTRVPLVLLGSGVTPGRYDQPASPADIAPTLGRLCGVALPTATGRVLAEAVGKGQ
jgi:predicted AlkP superfamily pyrophosphatase or phosphodiesterase